MDLREFTRRVTSQYMVVAEPGKDKNVYCTDFSEIYTISKFDGQNWTCLKVLINN